MSDNSSTSSMPTAFKLPPAVKADRSDDPLKEMCQIAIANIRRMEETAEALEATLGSGLVPSELSRLVRTAAALRRDIVKLITASVKDLAGPLKKKNVAREV